MRKALLVGVLAAAMLAGTTGVAYAVPVAPKDCPSIPSTADDNILRTLRDIGNQRGVDDRVRLAEFETAWVESHANNLPCGDQDSLGVFQQRPSQGWGTPDQVMDPVYATNKFLDYAIPNAANNPGWTAGQVAQSVQRSEFPDRYDQAEGTARDLIARSNGL
ncbi:hypothetical protein [Fodinicola acaciae]|uniref:hypothetical protein n=1 Tax=Fodinicola acaciae TaxID=2681555 RepID=UPI0013D465F6|nr:hypothetical protein [Fodinicola acaciae]